MSLPESSSERKRMPMYRGLFKYFPEALADVSEVSYVGNEQHNPGQPIHWAKEKSNDHEDCILRHLADHAAGERVDPDGCRVLAKVAWRALAALQMEIERELECQDGTSSAQSVGVSGSGSSSPQTNETQVGCIVPIADAKPLWNVYPPPGLEQSS